MPELEFGLIDVFADRPLRGNPLAVVAHADGLSETQMRAIAREFNQAETTFLLKPRDARSHYRLRSFTAAGAEVFGSGHNALGAWLWLAYRGRIETGHGSKVYIQEIGTEATEVRIWRDGTLIYGGIMQSAFKLVDVAPDVRKLADALRLDTADLLSDPPPRVGHAGAGHLLVRLSGKEAVDRARPDADALLAAMDHAHDRGCYIYAVDPARPDQAYARFFNPSVGLVEDPATGTAAGPLAAYLAASGLLGADDTLHVTQGAAMGRESHLTIRLSPNPELIGPGVLAVHGFINVPDDD